MKITVTDLDARIARNVLTKLGFGLVEMVDPYNSGVLFHARIWSTVDEEGVPSGGEVGTLSRDVTAIAARYTLELNDFLLTPVRLAEVMTALLNPSLR